MRYVDAGYIIALSALALYSVTLVARRRRLTRAAALRAPVAAPVATGAADGGTAPADGASSGLGSIPPRARSGVAPADPAS